MVKNVNSSKDSDPLRRMAIANANNCRFLPPHPPYEIKIHEDSVIPLGLITQKTVAKATIQIDKFANFLSVRKIKTTHQSSINFIINYLPKPRKAESGPITCPPCNFARFGAGDYKFLPQNLLRQKLVQVKGKR